MKKYIFTAITIALIFTGCSGPGNDKNNDGKKDSLLNALEERDATMNDLIMSFNEIEMNLDSVTTKQRLISMNSGKSNEVQLNQKERINSEIRAINKLMDANTKKLKDLHRKYNSSNNKNTELEKTIVILNKKLTLKYNELTLLNEQLKEKDNKIEQLMVVIDTLFYQNMAQSQTIRNQSEELHTAYYIVETSAHLQQWNLIDNQGGFLGIGQTSKLSNNLDIKMFTQIDYTQVTEIPINSKGIKVVTTHPTGSFSLVKNGRTVEKLIISDPEKFWSASKYLVITL
ncbi:hypothetical protein [Aurantibacillus circumpalustris]|uniref:Cbp1 family collagen-binding glycoprotein adhesin n=1 Tax=Aurantibacillus circumpalustris TaxID=3036359 RepID=UPI00295B872D|nr:hypothetical protein [Aurantibacillus circumpalustris]